MVKKKYQKLAKDFPLEDVPFDLQSLIFEKIFQMDYLDIINFNSCSKFTADICNKVLPKTKVHLAVQSLQISNGLPILLKTSRGKREIAFDTVRPEIIFDVKELVLNTNDFEFCKRNTVKPGSYVIIRVPMLKEAIQEFLRTVSTNNLRAFFFKDDREVYLTPEIQKLEKLIVYNCGIDDEQLLSLPMPNFSFGNQSDITTTGMTAFLKEWISGERKISHVRFGVSNDLFNLDELCRNLKATDLVDSFEEEIDTEGERQMWICKDQEKHDGCLRINQLYARLTIFGMECCPKRMKKM